MNNDSITVFDVAMLGGAAMLVPLLAVAVSRAAASGALTRNGFIGIRMPSTMTSDEAWIAGHRAAVPLASISVFVAGLLLMVAAILVLMKLMIPAFVVTWIEFGAVLGLLIASSVKASRAARATEVSA